MSSRATRSRPAAASPARKPAAASSAAASKKRAASDDASAASSSNGAQAKKTKRSTVAPESKAKRGRSPAEAAEEEQSPPPAKKARAKSAAPVKSTRRSPSRSASVSRSRSRSRSNVRAAREAIQQRVEVAIRDSVAEAARKAQAGIKARRELAALKQQQQRSRSRSASPSVSRSRSRSRSVSRSRGRAAAPAANGRSTGNVFQQPRVQPSNIELEPDSPRSSSSSGSGSGSEDEEDDDEEEETSAPARRAPTTPQRSSSSKASAVSSGPFSPNPSAAGLKVLPRRSSLPPTPSGVGRSTVLSDVRPPSAVFLSPFRHDVLNGHRQSSARTDGWEGQPTNYGDDDRHAGSQLQHLRKSQAKSNANKQLRPTSAQEEADRARDSGASSNGNGSMRKRDTPTVNRARSRLNGDDEAGSASRSRSAIEEESDEDDSSSADRSSASHQRRASGAQSGSSRSGAESGASSRSGADRRVDSSSRVYSTGGLIQNRDSTFPWTAAALLLVALAQFLVLMTRVVPDRTDVLGVRWYVQYAQDVVNGALDRWVKPWLGHVFLLPNLDFGVVERLSTQYYAAWWLTPLLYMLAGFVVKKGYEVTARDATYVAPQALASTVRQQQRHAHHVFVAVHAFVSAVAFWLFFQASEAAVASVPGGVHASDVAPAFSWSWAATYLIVTSFSWALTEFANFAHVFSASHTLLWVLVAVVSELAFWSLLPLGFIRELPVPLQNLYAAAEPLLPKALASATVLLPLLTIQSAESIKALGGVAYTPLGRVLLWFVPVAYVFGLSRTTAILEHAQAEYWVAGVLFLAAVAATSTWEVLQHVSQLAVRKAKTY